MTNRGQAAVIVIALATGFGGGLAAHRFLLPEAPSTVGETAVGVHDTRATAGMGLYTDDEVQAIIRRWQVPEQLGDEESRLELSVVPDGSSAPLITVFAALGIEQSRLVPDDSGFNQLNLSVFLKWHLSPSFTLGCSTTTSTVDDGVEPTDPKREEMIAARHDPKRQVFGVCIIRKDK